MNVPQDIADRLRALGHAPEQYADIVRSEGADFVRGYIERLEDADRLFYEWSPKLREFAANCRVNNPCPSGNLLTERDRAKLPIYESLITHAEQLPQRLENEVLICSIPLVGMPVAMSLWPGADPRSVFLTPEELLEWHVVYDHPEGSFWWFTNYWWHIEDPPRANSLWAQDTELTVDDGTDPWLVVSGLSWGSLAGGETADLWSWNGKQAVFMRTVGCCDF